MLCIRPKFVLINTSIHHCLRHLLVGWLLGWLDGRMGFSGASEVLNNLPAHRQLPRSWRTMEPVARKQSALPEASITDAECKRELLKITYFYELFLSQPGHDCCN